MTPQPIAGQLDLLAEIERIERRAAPHAPLHFHQDECWTPGEVVAAFQIWVDEHGRFNCLQASHMWHVQDGAHFGMDATDPAQLATWTGDRAHVPLHFTANLGCPGHGRVHRGPCLCTGSIVHRGFCTHCRHWTPVHGSEDAMVEDLLDHCWTGWRELPILRRATVSANSTVVPEDYPQQWRIPGAPVITARSPMGTRHIPGNSPFGGYDYGVVVGPADHR